MQLAASVTVTVYVPAAKFERPAVVAPVLQRYETEPLAPVSEAVAVPSFDVLHVSDRKSVV